MLSQEHLSVIKKKNFKVGGMDFLLPKGSCTLAPAPAPVDSVYYCSILFVVATNSYKAFESDEDTCASAMNMYLLSDALFYKYDCI